MEIHKAMEFHFDLILDKYYKVENLLLFKWDPTLAQPNEHMPKRKKRNPYVSLTQPSKLKSVQQIKMKSVRKYQHIFHVGSIFKKQSYTLAAFNQQFGSL